MLGQADTRARKKFSYFIKKVKAMKKEVYAIFRKFIEWEQLLVDGNFLIKNAAVKTGPNSF